MYFPETPTQRLNNSTTDQLTTYNSQSSYYKYWGKTVNIPEDGPAVHLLPYHSLDVSAIGQVLLSRHKGRFDFLTLHSGLTLELFTSIACYFLAIHDMGKFSDTFQSIQPKAAFTLRDKEIKTPYDIRHDALGYLLWDNSLNEDFSAFFLANYQLSKDEFFRWLELFDVWALAFAGHHGQTQKNVIHH